MVTTGTRIDAAWVDSDPYPQIIDGRERRDGRVFAAVDPSTGDSFASWTEARDSDVEDALQSARRSFDGGEWRRAPLSARAAVLEAVAARIRSDAERLAALEALDTGKAVSGALVYDVHEAATAFAHAAGMARDLHGDVRRSSFPPKLLPGGGPDVLTMRLREAAGVVVELLPWNGPLMTGSQRLAAALAAGCSIVVKAPEEAVVSVVHLARILAECGVPPGVVNVVLGRGETVGERLIADPRVDLISLTGSVATGRRVMEVAARNLTAVNLELGGKAPLIVFADADLDQAIPWAMMAAFVNMGEVCVAGSRLLVEASVYDRVVEGVAAASAGLPIGDALDPNTFIGPLVTAGARRPGAGFRPAGRRGRRRRSARECVGPGRSSQHVRRPGGPWPCASGSEVEQNEVFGPVLAATSFADEAEALRIANGTRYGLNATVFTQNLERAFRLADQLDAGEININCHFAPDMNGGRGEPRRMSGLSRTGVNAYTTLRAVNLQVRA